MPLYEIIGGICIASHLSLKHCVQDGVANLPELARLQLHDQGLVAMARGTATATRVRIHAESVQHEAVQESKMRVLAKLHRPIFRCQLGIPHPMFLA